MPRLPFLLIVACCLLACRAFAQTRTAPEQKEPTTLPTAEDAKLVERFDALAKELDGPNSRAREVINQTRDGGVRRALLGESPTTEKGLAWCRGMVQNQIVGLTMLKEAPPIPTFHIPRSADEITIDGKLDEPAWQKALQVPIVYEVNSAKPIEDQAPAVCALLWDDQNLYLAFDCPDSDIVAPRVKHNGPVYAHDCVEVFLLPDMEKRQYWELNISPLGDLFECLMTKYLDKSYSDRQFEPPMAGLKFAHTIRGTANDSSDRDQGYVSEMVIPFKSLPGIDKPPAAGDRFYGLLTRVQHQGDPEKGKTTFIGHVPQAGWFHNIWCYSPFVLDK